MSREIKFEVMFYVFNKDLEREIKKHYTTVDRLCDDNSFFKQGVEIVCKRQFTGLKDKNSIEIYEGDICINKSGRLGEVVWFDPAACFDFVAINESGDNHGYSFQMAKYSLEVVGNTYENPELLTGMTTK